MSQSKNLFVDRFKKKNKMNTEKHFQTQNHGKLTPNFFSHRGHIVKTRTVSCRQGNVKVSSLIYTGKGKQ